MKELLSFLIIFVFFIIAIVVMFGICMGKSEGFNNTEGFNNKDKQTTTKFYTYPPTKMEKLNSLYTPIICRPPEHSGLTYSGNCTNELYPKSTSPMGKGEMTAPCKPEVEAKYYAMRPLLTPGNYDKMLENLFSAIIEEIPEDVPQKNLIYQTQFCNKDCYNNVMKYIMKKINYAKKNLPIFKEYAKSDTWGGEQFAFLNEKVFVYSNQKTSELSQQDQAKMARYGKNPGHKKYVVTFTLHNTLRSSSSDVVAILYQKDNKFFMKYINFANKKPTNIIQGQNIGSPGKGPGINLNNENIPGRDSGPNWIYGNTIQNNLFNLKGFYDSENPENNILIPGGVPEEFTEVLQKCDQSALLNPGTAQRLPGGTRTDNANEINAPVYPLFPSSEIKWDVNV